MDNKNSFFGFPKGWVYAKLGEVCLAPQYGWTTSASDNGKLKLLRTSDITSGSINWNSVPFCKKEPPEKEKYLLKDGDIVISRAGSVGYSILVKKPNRAAFASYLIRFRPLTNANYVAYFLKSPLYWKSISEKKLGIAVPNVNASKLKQIEFPLPPLPEQHRIVAKIEKVFSDLDAGVDALKKIKVQLKRYRQVVLKYAFEGKMTAEWRDKHKDKLEQASILLEGIKEERKQDTKSKYRELSTTYTQHLVELPDKWEWTKLDIISRKITDGEHLRPKTVAKGVPFLSAKDVRDEGVIFDNTLYVSKEDAIKFRNRCDPENGDILVVSRGATIGRSCIVNTNKVFCLLGSVILIKPFSKISNKYIAYAIKSANMQKQLISLSGSTAQQAIYIRDIRNTLIAIPSISEQQEIVEDIEQRFFIADKIGAIVDNALKQAERLRQSILKRAFEGKLIPQDPNDESAKKLLERIKAEKEKMRFRQKTNLKLKTTKPKRR